MRIIKTLSILGMAAVVFTIAGCSAEEKLPVEQNRDVVSVGGREVPADAYVPGLVQIKVTEELSKSLDEALSNIAPELRISKMERTFPYAGEFEARTREAGLHLWYNVYFDSETPLSRAGESLASIDGVRFMEYRPVMVRVGNPQVVERLSGDVTVRKNAVSEVFDDQYVSEQWHYYNDGSFSDIAVSGSDINVLPVWKNGVVGSPDVIVAVNDGGVDVGHEDLADNIWTGLDEEGNVINGYDFFSGDYTIEADEHGTHVAGTIGAVNNNGTGVCGIAGGNKAAGLPGVKIMSCQIFYGPNGKGNGYEAIKWSADHGAVISQNSWGYVHGTKNDVPKVDKDAIDYFVKYAGLDSAGNQVGPMAGGVVIFAAGNDAVNVGYPQVYEEIVSVAAIASTFKLASYSNFGTWVDIAAPGGDANLYGNPIDGVLSTLPNNGYGAMSGTSMACPHVSGVAALLVSEFGGPGFTADELKKRLLMNVTPVDAYTPSMAGYMGSGMVNAALAVEGLKEGGVDAVKNLELSSRAEKIDFSFTLPSGKALKNAYVYLSVEELTADNLMNARICIFPLDGYKGGDTFSGTINTGMFNCKYYAAVSVVSADNEISPVSDVASVVTGKNSAPVIEPLDGTDFIVKIKEKSTFRFVVTDSEDHKVAMSISPQFNYLKLEYKEGNDTVKLVFNGSTANKGERDIKLTAKDEYGASDAIPLHVKIVENSEPVLVNELPDVIFGSVEDEPYVLDLKEYVHDEDNDPFTVEYTFTGDEVASITSEDSKMIITPLAVGAMKADLVISDPSGASVVTSMDIILQTSGQPLDFYPNPVADSLYIRANEGREEGHVTLYSPTGAVLYDEVIEVGAQPVDMSGYPAGVYSIKVIYKEKEIKSNIVKL